MHPGGGGGVSEKPDTMPKNTSLGISKKKWGFGGGFKAILCCKGELPPLFQRTVLSWGYMKNRWCILAMAATSLTPHRVTLHHTPL